MTLKDKIAGEEKHKHWPLKIILIVAAVFCFLLVAVFVANATVNYKYANVFLPGTKLGSVDIGSLTYEQAKNKVQERLDTLSRDGFIYVGQGKKATIYPIISAGSADSSFPLVMWQPEKSLDKILKFQKDERPANLLNKISVMLGGKTWSLDYTWGKERHLNILAEDFKGLLPVKKEASFEFEQNGGLKISPEIIGQTFTYEQAMSDTEEQIKKLQSKEINLVVVEDRATITSAVINKFRDQIINTAQQGDLIANYNEQATTIANADWRQWLQIKFNKNKSYLGFDIEKVKKYFDDKGLSADIEVLVQDARFKLNNGRVSEFMASQEGKMIDWIKTIASAEKIISDKKNNFDIIVETVKPKVMNSDANDLGIGTLLGTGESDFKGSPPNRIHNIGVGADTLNGLLINVGEEFSLITALGDIDGQHGYKQELVIKGNKTIPEYGGGLCQIGTTVFRAALGTGLPITERRNHSYRVVYYEPAGMDATIYDPKPDLKFLNDTGNYVLIQSRIEGTKLYFDFWGTSDGRVATTTKPTIYNVVSPAPKKIVKTTDLPVGQTRCTESAHAGADAKFDYIVQYLNKAEPVKVTFSSHYVPWQAVCLVGATAEEIAAEQSGTTATTTPSTTPSQ
ncbi:MAG: VanW family protein [Patescibacteria group bacterium]|jgi:vancomycin resistance protein YoaR